MDSHEPSTTLNAEVRLDVEAATLSIESAVVTDPEVLREASRWTTGERGPVVTDPEVLAAADLSPFLHEALSIGSRVLSLASQSAETTAVTAAVKAASDSVDDSVRRATESMGHTVREMHETLTSQVTRLVGGESPELMERLRPMLARVGTDLERQAAEAIERATEALREDDLRRHTELTELLHKVRREVAVKVAADEAASDADALVRGVTTIKGFDYEAEVNIVCASIASSMGEEYRATGETAGMLPRNKKGDGVFLLSGDLARIVVEAHDGRTKQWGDYLAEAERNRGAVASIGLVKNLTDNGGQMLRVLGPKRMILAFDPAVDDIEIIRTVVLLMRTVALTSAGRFGVEEVANANEAIRETLAVLDSLEEAHRSANAITGHVSTIQRSITKTLTTAQRHLHEALNSLAGAPDAPEPPGDDESSATDNGAGGDGDTEPSSDKA